MKAEIIAVGSELLTPDHSDTNSLWITQKLNEAGFQVHGKTVVGDDEEAIADRLRFALARAQLVIVGGGLGPTEDDVTRPGVARALGRRLVRDTALLEELRARFTRRGYPWGAPQERQADLVEDAEVLPNAVGSAPGMWLEERGVHVALLPGPPAELMPMFESEVMPRLQGLGRGRRLARKSIRIAGMTESQVDGCLAPIYQQYPQIQTTVLAAASHIGVRLQQWLAAGEPPAALEELAGKIHAALGSAVFTEDDEPLEEVVGRMLRESRRTLAVAESCTAGLLGGCITRVPGSTDYFLGGILCYSNDAKIRLCGVPEELLRAHGAASAEVAEALARGVRAALGSSIGLAITGIAGPGGATAEKPVGLVYVGYADDAHTSHQRRIFSGARNTVRERSAYLALSFLRSRLLAAEEARS